MWKKIENYYWTLRYLKKSQIFYLAKNRLKRGKRAVTAAAAPETAELPLWMEELDACPDYLKRFCVPEILEGQVRLLYEVGTPGGKNWENSGKSHLWNFNLHYLEFLIPLAAAYGQNADVRYYECYREYCRNWIRENREGSGDGWHPYTISLRLTNLWICMDRFSDQLENDREFLQELRDSMYAQYRHLRKSLELHLLGNHYFENLKGVVLGSLYFQEPEVYEQYKRKLREEIQEQILPDGVHYERSMMYHKIILEDLTRVARAVRNSDPSFCRELLPVLKKMADAAWSLENGLGRTPLFNDAGDNVAKPLSDALLQGLKSEFGICPDAEGHRAFPDAGYYCLGNGHIKIILDAGKMAPDHMPGHGHCDGLSFELGLEGRPFLVNAGTGQYQGELRPYFRSTAAHNTVLIDGKEQSVCWGEHRVGKRITAVSGAYGDRWVGGSLTTCFGKRQVRQIGLKDRLVVIKDRIRGRGAGYFHLAPEYVYTIDGQCVQARDQAGKEVCRFQAMPEDTIRIHTEGRLCVYAPEFGKTERIQVLEILWDSDGEEHELRLQFL